MSLQVLLVGCGNMGFAMLKGWLDANRLKAGDGGVIEPADALRERAASLGVTALATIDELAADIAPRLIIFAVKPQVILDILPAYARFSGTATFLSVAAGTPISAFEALLGTDAAIVRCMPNTPAAIGKGMMVVVSNANVTAATSGFVSELLSASGEVETIDDETLMDAVTAVSGSGPAYLFHFIECLAAAGEAAGLPQETAKRLAMQTVYGAASLAAGSTDEPAELRKQVTSPNGTTAAALSVLMEGDRLKTLVTAAVEAAKTRSIELGK